MWVELMSTFFCVGTMRSRNTVVFSFDHVFDVASAEMPTQIKIVDIKYISSHEKKSQQKGIFVHDHHHIGKNIFSSHEKNVDRKIFLPTITSCKQK